MATPAEKSSLSNPQTALASRVLAEAVGDLARQGHKGKDLTERATDLADALHSGICKINAPSQPHSFNCPLGELRQRRKEELALLESQALKARGAVCVRCWDQGENGGPIHPQAMSYDSRGEQP